ncbi:hypothetical protein H671_4g11602 [Cricetulus griseus]|uniref:Uncharacterized protein n=1 Tax=Cricetulus griseus TaxID=10029 RepID=A0A061I8J5_CRIGR|nr:hypothetical protein H671_4g11602 [Cricetulus griseus]
MKTLWVKITEKNRMVLQQLHRMYSEACSQEGTSVAICLMKAEEHRTRERAGIPSLVQAAPRSPLFDHKAETISRTEGGRVKRQKTVLDPGASVTVGTFLTIPADVPPAARQKEVCGLGPHPG